MKLAWWWKQKDLRTCMQHHKTSPKGFTSWCYNVHFITSHFILDTCFPSGRKHLNFFLFSTKNIENTALFLLLHWSFPCFTSYGVVVLQLSKKLNSLTSRSSSCSFLICSKRNCSAISLSCASLCRTSDKLMSVQTEFQMIIWTAFHIWMVYISSQTQY